MRQTRLDQYLTANNHFDSRQQAQAAIMAGDVIVNGKTVTKPGTTLKETPEISIKNKLPFVSRGGLKLQQALKVFKISVRGQTCIDIGSSTGGFTDCLLQNGAESIYAVDCGTNQLAYKLRCDKRVTVMEKTNARHLEPTDFPANITIGVMDLSFISIIKVLPTLKKLLAPEASIISLIKPQFEGNQNMLDKGGIVKSGDNRRLILENLLLKIKKCGYNPRKLIPSPIKGAKGNIEYLVLLTLCPGETKYKELDQSAHDLINEAMKTEPL